MIHLSGLELTKFYCIPDREISLSQHSVTLRQAQHDSHLVCSEFDKPLPHEAV